MHKINYFSETSEVQNKTILLRLDLNVPIENKIIQDDTRIKLSLPFIKQLIQKKSKNYNNKSPREAKRPSSS